MSAWPDAAPIRLRVLATSDLHAHLLAHDYLTDEAIADGGLDRTAVLIARARAEVPGSILLDNGDFLHGTPLADDAAEARAAGRAGPDPVIAAMNSLGFDAAALGNHELDEAPGPLSQALSQARFPILCANLERAARDLAGPVVPWTILERSLGDPDGGRHAVRVGVIGFAPPETRGWARAQFGDALRVRGIVEAARDEVPALRAAGAQIVVALCHAGLGEPTEIGAVADGDTALTLAEVEGIDALVCGHTHRVFPSDGIAPSPGVDPRLGRLRGVPAVMPGWRGSHLGVVDLGLAPRPGGGWRVLGASVRTRAVADLPRESTGGLASEPVVAAAHAATSARMRAPVARLVAPLSEAFVHVGESSALDLVAAVKREAARRLLAGGPHEGLPLVSVASPIRAGGRHGAGRFLHIPPGVLTARHLADLYPHPDTLVVLKVTGAVLRDWLERAAGRFAHVPAGSGDAPLLDEGFPSYRFDVAYGVRYEIDLSRPARFDAVGREVAPGSCRIRRIEHDGRPVADEDVFAVAAKRHRISGEGLYAPLADAPRIASGDVPLRRVLEAYVAERQPLGPQPAATWRFAAMPGTTALVPGPRDATPPDRLRMEPVSADEASPHPGGPDDETPRGPRVGLFRIHL